MEHHRSPFHKGLLALAVIVAAAPVAAQPFERAYGATSFADQAHRGATSVHLCGGGGSIAVGTAGVGLFTRVYVVRTGAAGTPMWERLYDLQPAGGGDTGESIVELGNGSGFVIAGSTRGSNSRDAFLMKINCAGLVQWIQSYQGPQDEIANDVVEARTGDPASGTRPGDLLVAGSVTLSGSVQQGLLFRTDAAGVLIWNRATWSAAAERSTRWPRRGRWVLPAATCWPPASSRARPSAIAATSRA